MRLVCYPTVEPPPEVRPAPVQRDWMTASPDRFAYRCLPLTIANSHGWELLVDAPFEAVWNGGAKPSDLTVQPLGEGASRLAESHFGCGVLTFTAGYLVETAPGYNLWVAGPVNRPKDGISPLAGVVESDWSPYTFTMNWLFTRPGAVRFERGEPFCHFFPVPRGLVEEVEPVIRDLESEPGKEALYERWREERNRTIGGLKVFSGAAGPVWEGRYLRGEDPAGAPVEAHQSRLEVRPFADLRKRGEG